jgi:RES domain-containing protein
MDDIVARVLRNAPRTGWAGDVWRIHTRRYSATDPGGSLRSQGRWHRGGTSFPPDQIFAALYTTVSDAVATWELIRHSKRSDANEMWLRFTTVKLSRLRLRLVALLDLRDPSVAGLSLNSVTSDDYLLTQTIGAAAFTQSLEGLLVPSATGVGMAGLDYNVVIFTDNLRSGSEVVFIDSVIPNLPS